MGKKSKLVEFWTKKPFQIRACVISTQKAKHLDATTMFTYSHANTPLSQSECAYYLSYFINMYDCKVRPWGLLGVGGGGGVTYTGEPTPVQFTLYWLFVPLLLSGCSADDHYMHEETQPSLKKKTWVSLLSVPRMSFALVSYPLQKLWMGTTRKKAAKLNHKLSFLGSKTHKASHMFSNSGQLVNDCNVTSQCWTE